MMGAIRKRTENFTEADIDEEVILMRLDTGELLSLADTAAAAWRLIDGQRGRTALIEALGHIYIGDLGQVEADVDDLLKHLSQAGLIAEA